MESELETEALRESVSTVYAMSTECQEHCHSLDGIWVSCSFLLHGQATVLLLCVHMCTLCVPECEGQRLTLNVFLDCSHLYIGKGSITGTQNLMAWLLSTHVSTSLRLR